eukprot:gnl/Chilomastix_cuspidata/1267.p1 GENE.gnl/Chilomastix_cuspidata/1267~~gnl/Chilomastix_cuspidata/1267.p1  ORF type:complete len:632 (-),score=250.24 gnl/Chilomastix_cuspidata/1267:2-1897(-)
MDSRPSPLDRFFWLVAGGIFIALSVTLTAILIPQYVNPDVKSVYELDEIAAKVESYLPTVITADTSGITSGDARALHHLRKAADLIDELFLGQASSDNKHIRAELRGQRNRYKSYLDASGTNEADYLLYANLSAFFDINYGAYETLNEMTAFLAPTSRFQFPEEHPATATYYPRDITDDEWDSYLAATAEGNAEEYACAMSSFSVIYRPADRENRTGVPNLACRYYSDEYEALLTPLAEQLRQAAALVSDASLAAFLNARADAFFTNSYGVSDEAWLSVASDSALDVTVGPYETYMDEFKGLRAAFEIFVGVTDVDETARIGVYTNVLQSLEDALPEDEACKRAGISLGGSVKVIDLVFSAGEAPQGSQTLAFNLPNDPTPNDMAAKQTMLINVQRAKFEHILTPIAEIALGPPAGAQLESLITFDANFQQTVSHEFAHAFGPVETRDGESCRIALAGSYSAIEEAKADVGAAWSVVFLAENQDAPTDGRAIPCWNANDGAAVGDLPTCDIFLDQFFATFLAGSFRSIRFGAEEAHGKAVLCYFNELLDLTAFTVTVDENGPRFWYDKEKMIEGVDTILTELLEFENSGNKDAADEWLSTHAVIGPNLQEILDDINAAGIPVDLRPIYDDF